MIRGDEQSAALLNKDPDHASVVLIEDACIT
jgi:hypothetical protein